MSYPHCPLYPWKYVQKILHRKRKSFSLNNFETNVTSLHWSAAVHTLFSGKRVSFECNIPTWCVTCAAETEHTGLHVPSATLIWVIQKIRLKNKNKWTYILKLKMFHFSSRRFSQFKMSSVCEAPIFVDLSVTKRFPFLQKNHHENWELNDFTELHQRN